MLLNAGEVESMAGRFAWAGEAFPAGDYSLRNMDKSRYKLLLEKEKREITQMDETQAFHELYPGAVYIHEGELYEVLKLDLESRTAYGVPFAGNYYTVPSGTQGDQDPSDFQRGRAGKEQDLFRGILTWRKSSPCTRSFSSIIIRIWAM